MKVTKKYDICYPDPLSLQKGDVVSILKKEETPEWDGWYFCKDHLQKEGWISRDYLRIEDTKATLIKPYSAKELSANEGEEALPLFESCGWSWCKKSTGEEGWLPNNILEGKY